MGPHFLPEDVQAAFARVLVDEWVRLGVTDAVACPGSRSSPVLVALAEAEEAGRLRLHVLLDERAAGFFALGLGLASGVPAPVVTTSGTASVELHASAVEAHHSNVPMLLVTADRPAELHGWGAPQTIEQTGLFGGVLRWQASPGVPEAATSRTWRSLASRALCEALGNPGRPGPVQLNLAFREPLTGRAGAFLATAPEVAAGRSGSRPWHRALSAAGMPPKEVVEALAGAGRRGLVVAGAGAGEPAAVQALSQAMGWPVLAGPLSGCRFEGSVCAADALLRAPQVRKWHPEAVLRLGSPWASRVLSEWLASLDCPQWLVDRWGVWRAPDRQVAQLVVAAPEALCWAVAERAAGQGSPGGWASQWAEAERAAQAAIDEVLAGDDEPSGPAIARALTGGLPPASTLVVASSMPVRDLEWWGRPRLDLRVLANRGANGIDGCLSTALGVACGAASLAPGPGTGGGRVVGLLGDLAFLYDASALLWAKGAIDVVVVDNGGGGIFDSLPQAASQPPERFERLWGTPHGLDLVKVAQSYGAEAEAAEDVASLAQALCSAEAPSGPKVWVARSSRKKEAEVRRALWARVQGALERL